MSSPTDKINWQEWSPDALELAKREGKPIMLAITATWCHWCHVMDRHTFLNTEVADLVNTAFVPIRVDNDRRPDLNTRYNMGGWPTVTFLSPDGDILTGATYLPPKQMKDLLSKVAGAYAEEHELLEDRAEELRQRREDESQEMTSTALLTEYIPLSILRAIDSAFDSAHGGFGTQQKFPHISGLEFLIEDYRRTGNTVHLDMVTRTLDAMRSGGLYDPVEGGFFRYSTTRDWSVPHYEKMLEDNAGLLHIYLEAYGITGNENYFETAKSVMRYLENTLYDETTKAFFGSQDADEEYYGLAEEERSQRQAPSVDLTIYSNWNGIAARAYLRAYEIIGDRQYLDRALGILDFLINSCRYYNGFYHYFDGGPDQYGILTDQVQVGRALISAYECTGSRKYLDIAGQVANYIEAEFIDPIGGFFDVTEQHQEDERLLQREKLLDENAFAARFLNRLSYYAFEPNYRFLAEAALRVLTSSFEHYGILAAPYALAVVEALEEPVRVAVAGPKENPRTQELINTALRSKEPSSLLQVFDEEMEGDEPREFGIEPSDQPQAAVCAGEMCRVTSNPDEIASAIREAEQKNRE